MKTTKTREERIEEVLEKDQSNLKLTIDKKDKTIQEYIRFLKLIKIEYQK